MRFLQQGHDEHHASRRHEERVCPGRRSPLRSEEKCSYGGRIADRNRLEVGPGAPHRGRERRGAHEAPEERRRRRAQEPRLVQPAVLCGGNPHEDERFRREQADPHVRRAIARAAVVIQHRHEHVERQKQHDRRVHGLVVPELPCGECAQKRGREHECATAVEAPGKRDGGGQREVGPRAAQARERQRQRLPEPDEERRRREDPARDPERPCAPQRLNHLLIHLTCLDGSSRRRACRVARACRCARRGSSARAFPPRGSCA